MPRPGEVFGKPPDPEEPAEQQLWEGEIQNTPANAKDEVFVTIEEFDEGKHRFGPVLWRPLELEGKEVLPEKGNRCLLAKPTTAGSVWLLGWG
jgi:hypothetical protein